jgi:hypothetical protein
VFSFFAEVETDITQEIGKFLGARVTAGPHTEAEYKDMDLSSILGTFMRSYPLLLEHGVFGAAGDRYEALDRARLLRLTRNRVHHRSPSHRLSVEDQLGHLLNLYRFLVILRQHLTDGQPTSPLIERIRGRIAELTSGVRSVHPAAPSEAGVDNDRGVSTDPTSGSGPSLSKLTVSPPARARSFVIPQPISYNQARDMLVALREYALSRTHPPIPRERGLLRRSLLDGILRFRVVDEESLKQRFGCKLQKVDPRQLTLLPIVFAIVRAVDPAILDSDLSAAS